MKIKGIVAASIMAAAATVIASTTAQAEPATASIKSVNSHPIAVRHISGVNHEIGHSTQLSDGVVTTITAGKPAATTPTLASATLPQPNLKDVSSKDQWNQQLEHASYGALIGGAIGGFIGLVVGGIIIFPIPIATGLIGAGIGLLAAGGLPLINAGAAYFGGQP